jgi:hypothetical protein
MKTRYIEWVAATLMALSLMMWLSIPFVACVPEIPLTKEQIYISNTQVRDYYVHYYKDERTNMCFTRCPKCYYSASLSYVPCTLEVEKLVEPWQ